MTKMFPSGVSTVQVPDAFYPVATHASQPSWNPQLLIVGNEEKVRVTMVVSVWMAKTVVPKGGSVARVTQYLSGGPVSIPQTLALRVGDLTLQPQSGGILRLCLNKFSSFRVVPTSHVACQIVPLEAHRSEKSGNLYFDLSVATSATVQHACTGPAAFFLIGHFQLLLIKRRIFEVVVFMGSPVVVHRRRASKPIRRQSPRRSRRHLVIIAYKGNLEVGDRVGAVRCAQKARRYQMVSESDRRCVNMYEGCSYCSYVSAMFGYWVIM